LIVVVMVSCSFGVMDRGASGAGTPAVSLPAAADAGTANSAAVNQSSVPHGRATRIGIRID
jgi:hypothetical protein